jgi:transmembrane protein 70
MLATIRHLTVCHPTKSVRFTSLIRLVGSLQEQHKERSVKAKDFFIDPNTVKAFEKLKKGEFIPEGVNFDSLNQMRDRPPIGIKYDDQLAKREILRQDFLGKLVYVGKLDKSFRAAKSLSLASSLGGAIMYPVMLPKILADASMIVAVGYTIISATFVLLTPSLIQMISKRYLTTLYYQEQTQQFTGFYKNFFMMERQIKFRAEDVEVPPITGMFTSMLIKNQPFFINHEDFLDKPVLMKMLGYDKEFDFSKYTKDLPTDDGTGMGTNGKDKTK